MEKHINNQKSNPVMRRDFLKVASVLGLGTIFSATLNSKGAVPQTSNTYGGDNKATGTILTKKRTLGSKSNPLTVSAI